MELGRLNSDNGLIIEELPTSLRLTQYIEAKCKVLQLTSGSIGCLFSLKVLVLFNNLIIQRPKCLIDSKLSPHS